MVAFVTPNVSLELISEPHIRTLPELVDFHIENNPRHLFCLQAEKEDSESGKEFIPVSYERLQRAILRCQAWLEGNAPGIHPPIVGNGAITKKCAPVAILMESHVGLAVYVLALMGMGVPVVLLSARLSPLAVRHLVHTTGAKVALVSGRLHPLVAEAFPGSEHDRGEKGQASQDSQHEVVIRLATGHEAFLEEEPVTSASVAHPNHYVSEEDRQVLILHSSGTSGLPKPIYCSHRHFLGFARCHNFSSAAEAHGLTISTSPFYHGFGIVPICLSLGVGKTFCIPPPSVIPTGTSVTALLDESGAKSLLTVPSILEEIALLPDNRGVEVLRRLDFVAFGGGIPKASIGAKLEAAGVKLINHYGATETGPLTLFFVPHENHNWRHIRLREDTLGPLEVKLDLTYQADESGQVYRLSMRPFGWEQRFELQDLLMSPTGAPEGEFSIAGRTDDLICLATGEKVRPTILESLLRQHDGVKDATAFGDNQFELGVIVESNETLKPDQIEAFKSSIWPIIEQAGHEMDDHAKISSPAAILIFPPGALPRSDKGTILRREVGKKFAKEIADVYQCIESNVNAPSLDLLSPASSIRSLIRDNIEWRVPLGDWSDDDDFFELGMDSLQATKLRRLIMASVRATTPSAGGGLTVNEIAEDFVYRNSSVNKLAGALTTTPSMGNGLDESAILEQLADKYSGRDRVRQEKATVVIAGASGSLGSFLLSKLLDDDSVGRVVCLNRHSREDAVEKQKRALKSRGILVNDGNWSKIEVHATYTSAPNLGLNESQYDDIAAAVTHIMHISWPMSFKMALPSFDASFRTLQNLIQLTSRAHYLNPWKRPRLLFISSISTVGNYPSVQGGRSVPEVCVQDQNWALGLGYAKAKLICEKIVQRAVADHPEIEAGLVRIGQIAGASTGYWNTDEHFVALVTSSQTIGRFPDLPGTLSWLPVDSAASALVDIIFDQKPLHLVYHLENPIRQDWQEVVSVLTKELHIPRTAIIPVQEWLDLVASAPEADNPARKLTDFLRNDFIKMSCGSIVLDTSVSQSVSLTMRAMGPVDENTLKAYVSYWRSIKFLK